MTENNLLKTIPQRLQVTLLSQDSTLQILINDTGLPRTVSPYLETMWACPSPR